MQLRRRNVSAVAAMFALLAASVFAVPNAARAQPDLVRGASILVAPKVMWDGSRDTLIELANMSNSQVSAFCLYFDGDSGLQINFDLVLSFQNSLRWNASTGLLCPDGGLECALAGGLIPPVPLGFRGTLACIEVDASGAEVAGNHLTAGVTLLDLGSGDAASYEPIALFGNENLNDDNRLCLGPDDPTDQCPFGREYDGCPDQWILNHVAAGAEDPIAGAGSSVSTVLTFFSCGQDFFTGQFSGVDVDAEVVNELEQRFTTSFQLNAPWSETSLEEIDSIFGFQVLGTTYAQTSLNMIDGSAAIVAREIRTTGGPSPATASAAFNLAHTGLSTNDNAIILPPR